MNKKHISVIAAAVAFSVVCVMTSCNKNESGKTTVISDSSEAETVKENTVSSADIPEFDDNGSRITSVVITDAQKVTVTNAAGLPVTELAVLGKDNQIVTGADGHPVPPVLAAANNSNKGQASPVMPDLSNPDAPAEYKGYSAFLWMSALTENNNFIPFSEDSEIVEVKIKIKDDAPDGNYTLLLNPNGSFCSKDPKDIPFINESPVITIGNAEAPASFDPSSTKDPVLYSENMTVKPGDEITLSFRLANNPGIVAGSSSFNYDNSVMTVEDIVVADALSNGTFQTNIH